MPLSSAIAGISSSFRIVMGSPPGCRYRPRRLLQPCVRLPCIGSIRSPEGGHFMRYAAYLLIAFSATTAFAAERTLDRTFTVKAGGTLTVTADSADISVIGGEGSQVRVHMVAESSSRDDL